MFTEATQKDRHITDLVKQIGPGQCKIAVMIRTGSNNVPYNRRDYYKTVFITRGSGLLIYADKEIHVEAPAIVFTNPLVPYAWENMSDDMTGYYCLFTENFMREKGRSDGLQDSPLFKVGADQVFFLNNDQFTYIESLFKRMLDEQNTDYTYKYEIIRNCVSLVLHEAMKSRPAEASVRYHNAATRIANLFLELLERQFPVDSDQYTLKLKKASDFATGLSVHVNHLNAAIHEMTGKSTTIHISERIMMEAKALLLHTDKSVSEIAYSLGFEYPSYFNNFFRKHTGVTPMSFRKNL
ncbi:helix-turn-helix domain-containing protein [Chitinophagaceae bacterium LWZ2-11]